MRRELAEITDANRPHVVEWLEDRSRFHSWFSTVIAGSLVALIVFGSKPGFATPSQTFLSVAQILLLLAVVGNFVSVWSIPSWKYRVRTGLVTDSRRVRIELAVNGWFTVVCFISGLTLAFIGNMPG
jgi:hypothetical protein